MKALDWLGLGGALLLFVVSLQVSFRTPRWWEYRGKVESPPALVLASDLLDDAESDPPAPLAWQSERRLFSPAEPVGTATALAPQSPPSIGAVESRTSAIQTPPPRFELVGCAETARGWAALVRDRETSETVMLCVGDVEPRWETRLVALHRDPFSDHAEIELRDVRLELTARATSGSSIADVVTPPDAGEAARPENRKGSL